MKNIKIEEITFLMLKEITKRNKERNEDICVTNIIKEIYNKQKWINQSPSKNSAKEKNSF